MAPAFQVTSRTLDVHLTTIINLLVRVGENCERIMVDRMKGVENLLAGCLLIGGDSIMDRRS